MIGAEVHFIRKLEVRRSYAKAIGAIVLLENLVSFAVFDFEGDRLITLRRATGMNGCACKSP